METRVIRRQTGFFFTPLQPILLPINSRKVIYDDLTH
jgi:hypothetical protein